MRWIGILSTAIAIALAVPAQAVEPAPGDLLLTAVGYGADIPKGGAFRLRTVDDTELNHHAARTVADALRARRYEIRADAPFVVTIETQAAWSGTPERNSLGEIDIGSGGLSVMVNLWSTTEDSLLRRQRHGPIVDRDYRIRLSIYHADRRRYVWHGEVVDLREGRNPFVACMEMVSALIDAMGETVSTRSVTLPEGDRPEGDR